MPTITATTTLTDEQLAAAPHPRILVAGLGNSILMDDGIGVHAALALQQDAEPGVCAVEVGTAVLDALHLFEWADKVLAIDAMDGGGAPGSLYLLHEQGLAKTGGEVSLHELSLKAALRLGQRELTPEVVLLGVQPATIDYGLALSETLQAALPCVIELARRIISIWREAGPNGDVSIEDLAARLAATPAT